MSYGAYIHIPFCLSKCWYCDFFSVVGDEAAMDEYANAVCREVDLYADRSLAVDTVFLGGGTPSCLPADYLGRILGKLDSSFELKSDAEVTCEANPETVDPDGLCKLRELGVNRLSMGVQSFHDAELRQLGRVHDAGRATQCIRDARDAGFENLSIDLISSLPGRSRASWEDTLKCAVSMSPEHISAYTLEYHEGTQFSRERDLGLVEPTREDLERELYLETIRLLGEHGYEHYEVSNFARPGSRCRHNLKYWRQEPYLGLGAAAHGFQRNQRYWNHRNLEEYLEDVSAGRKPVADREELRDDQLTLERLMLGLRTADGAEWGPGRLPDFPDGLVVHQGNRISLTPEGFALYDTICEVLAGAL